MKHILWTGALIALALAPAHLASPASATTSEAVEFPRVLDPALVLDLVAREPDIVTPIGLAIDDRGNLHVVESHTHFRPQDYAGPEHDRILRFEDRDGDGIFERRLIFADDLTSAMQAAFGPDGALYVTERNRVMRLSDRNGDGLADERMVVAWLETQAVYPHNGLGALHFGSDGWLYVGMGENHGQPFVLHGSDGRTYREPGGGGGLVFRIRPDGRELSVWATGLWNPFGLAFFGTHLLATDNDPETRPPNRLLDLIEGGDWGFRYRYGNDGAHPFVSWNGELPGTLPMVGPVGEGACALMPGGATRLGARYRRSVFVTSWSDRRIEVHTLRPNGPTLSARMSALVQGGRGFRPVAMATAPNGALYFTDWSVRSYAVHGKGRIWRLSAKRVPGQPPARAAGAPPASIEKRALDRLANRDARIEVRDLERALSHPAPHMRAAAVNRLARPANATLARAFASNGSPLVRLGALLALRRLGPDAVRSHIPDFLRDRDENVRIAALITAAEDNVLTPDEVPLLHTAVAPDNACSSRRLVSIYRAAARMVGLAPRANLAEPDASTWVDVLDGRRRSGCETPIDAVWALERLATPDLLASLARVAADPGRPDNLRADAVHALAHQQRFEPALQLLAASSLPLQIAAVRALQPVAGEAGVERALRALLAARARDPKAEILREELRFVLGEQAPADPRPTRARDWQRILAARLGDPDAGRRAFMSPATGCARCHRAGALGTPVGPPLTFIGNELPARLLESLLDPSVDIVWNARLFELVDGSLHVGMVHTRHPDGAVTLINAAGTPVELGAQQIVHEAVADTSLMPDGLAETLSVQAFVDLFAFLRTQGRH